MPHKSAWRGLRSARSPALSGFDLPLDRRLNLLERCHLDLAKTLPGETKLIAKPLQVRRLTWMSEMVTMPICRDIILNSGSTTASTRLSSIMQKICTTAPARPTRPSRCQLPSLTGKGCDYRVSRYPEFIEQIENPLHQRRLDHDPPSTRHCGPRHAAISHRVTIQNGRTAGGPAKHPARAPIRLSPHGDGRLPRLVKGIEHAAGDERDRHAERNARGKLLPPDQIGDKDLGADEDQHQS